MPVALFYVPQDASNLKNKFAMMPRARASRPQTSSSPTPPPSNFIAGRPKAALLFGSVVVLDVVFRYLSLFLLYINIKMGKKKMLNVRLASGHLYGEQLFTWLSLVVSLMASFCAVLFCPLDVLDEI